MGFEVALLEWSDARRGEGVRLVGRSTAPELVQTVRARLLAEATQDLSERREPGLRLVSTPKSTPHDPTPEEDG